MKITIIGSGNVATVLGRIFKDKGHLIIEIAGRNKVSASLLADQLSAQVCDNFRKINLRSDVYVIAVNDDAITEVSSQIILGERLVLHTCGSLPVNALQNSSANLGVLYALQSLRKETNYAPPIPFLINGNNAHSKAMIRELATSISTQVEEVNDEKRLQYHLSAVVVSNFTNHLFALTSEYCKRNGIEFDLLFPLIEEIINRMHNYEPSQMQTGPAKRGDEKTIQKHLAMLEKFPRLKHVYEIMSNSIRER